MRMCQEFIDLCVENEEKKIISSIRTNPSIINFKDQYMRTGLMYAAEYGYPNLISLLYSPENINQEDIDGNTPLTFALFGDLPSHARAVEILFSLGANKINMEYADALKCCMRKERLEIFNFNTDI